MTPSQLLAEAMMGRSADVPVSLAELVNPPAWMADALCKEHPHLSWFPERGDPVERPKTICRKCLVREPCLAYAVDSGQEAGIWGGMSPRGRQALRRSTKAA